MSRNVRDEGVAGSNPATPTNTWPFPAAAVARWRDFEGGGWSSPGCPYSNPTGGITSQ